jgi:hypothetical protein
MLNFEDDDEAENGFPLAQILNKKPQILNHKILALLQPMIKMD